MATVMIVEEIVEVIDDAEVHVVPAIRKVRRRCTNENVASTSSSSIQNTDSTPRPRKLTKKRSSGFSKGLQALGDRKKTRKIAAHRSKYGKQSLSAIKLRKIKAKCDERHDRKLSKQREMLREQNRALREQQRNISINRYQTLVETTREMRIQAERRSSLHLAMILAHLAERPDFFV